MARSACCQRSRPIPLVRIAKIASTTPGYLAVGLCVVGVVALALVVAKAITG